MITAELVKQLREMTGAGMMDCKKALTETDGDLDKAVTFLREKGIASAAKKSSRVAAEGSVGTYVSPDGNTAVIVEVNCETDFVGKNENFVAFVKQTARDIAEGVSEEALAEKAKEVIANIGENIVIRRSEKYVLDGDGMFGEYIHMGGKIGVLLQAKCDAALVGSAKMQEYLKDVAMQIAAANPTYLDQTQVPQEVIDKEKDILIHQAENEGKSKEIAEKMVAGRIQKMFKEVCLVDQPFVKDDKISIAQFTKNTAKELGGNIELVRFTRYQMGEGLEKRSENFAEEIAKQING
ncbi:MAG: elongation factor Ts [Eubacteriaceae bacterium]|nr:elongation factor Ts [Eubacteriaceae bacterium]